MSVVQTEMSSSQTIDATALIRRLMRRLVLPLFLLLLLNGIDRANVSFAAARMNADLGLSLTAYGLGVSLFFVGYLAIQLPSLWLLKHWGMRRWLCLTALVWGLTATGMAFITSATWFYALRIILGAAEGGFAPGAVLFLSQWIPRRFRASAIAAIMLAVPFSIVLGGPVSGWLLSISNPAGVADWRWMFLVEGLPTVLLALLVPRMFVDQPADALWLKDSERNWISAQLAAEDTSRGEKVPDALALVLRSGRFWTISLCWFALMLGAYGLVYWLPQIIHELSRRSPVQVGILTALPWFACGIGMIVNARLSDRAGERFWHVGLAALMSGLFMGLAIYSGSGAMALLLLILSGLTFGAAQSPFWTIPPQLLSKTTLASGLAIINMFGNSAGLLGPAAIGWIRERSGSFSLPALSMSLALIGAGIALICLRTRQEGLANPMTSASSSL
jgi:ACS family tartrate transporter-like MFS transporter